jgi:hypothetical protein
MILNSSKMILLLLLASCSNKNPEKRLRDFVEDPDNKITQRITIGDVGIVTRLLPSSYRSLMTKEKDSTINKEEFCYFDVKFNRKATDKQGKEKFLYLNFDMQNDFVLLINNRDSIAPVICQKIENGVTNSYEYMVVFEKGDQDWKDFTLYYHDKIFNIGTVAFVYNEKDILKIPE